MSEALLSQGFKDKMSKYSQIAEDSNVSFVPLIFLDTGKAHHVAAKFMKWLFPLLSLVRGIKKINQSQLVMHGLVDFRLYCCAETCVCVEISVKLQLQALNYRLRE